MRPKFTDADYKLAANRIGHSELRPCEQCKVIAQLVADVRAEERERCARIVREYEGDDVLWMDELMEGGS